jgi:DNA-binding transcriptional regulator YiaG
MDASSINTVDLSSFREAFLKYTEEHSRKPIPKDEIVVMVYDYIGQIKNGKQVRLPEVISDIRTKSERQSITTKEDLPVAYFSVQKFNGRKTDQNVVRHTGLFIIDIDKNKNLGIDLPQLKKDLIADKYTCICFTSPNGGIKVVVNTNITSIEHHDAFYESLKEYYMTNFNVKEVDTSGSNVARACFLPYDSECYYNSHSHRYCLGINQINILYANILNNKVLHNNSKSLLQVNSISLEEHYDNIMNLLKKWTDVGLYSNIFSIYRYYNIERGIMSTSVPFLEFIIAMNTYPYRLDWCTRLDEIYFKENPDKPISTDSIEGLDGMEVCEIVLPKSHVIKEHYRGRTLGSISMKLIFNNPFCHVDYLINAVRKINFFYCEDPNPDGNPKPDDAEVTKIVLDNYRKFLTGELDFSKVIRKKSKKNEISKKYVFWSRHHKSIDGKTRHLEATRTFHDTRNTKKHKIFTEAIQVLQDGKKLTQKRIAEHMGVSTRTIRRHLTPEFVEIINSYNDTMDDQSQRPIVNTSSLHSSI